MYLFIVLYCSESFELTMFTFPPVSWLTLPPFEILLAECPLTLVRELLLMLDVLTLRLLFPIYCVRFEVDFEAEVPAIPIALLLLRFGPI